MADQADATLLAAALPAPSADGSSFIEVVGALGLAARTVNAGLAGAAVPDPLLVPPRGRTIPRSLPSDDATMLAPAVPDRGAAGDLASADPTLPAVGPAAIADASGDATLRSADSIADAPAGPGNAAQSPALLPATPLPAMPASPAGAASGLLATPGSPATPGSSAVAARPLLGAPRSLLGGIVSELVAAKLLGERRAVSLGLQAREAGETLMRVLARELQAAELEPIFEFLAERCGQTLIRQKNELAERVAEAAWLPVALAEQRGVLPLRPVRDGEAPYATLDPCDLLLRDWIARISGLLPVPVPTLPDVLLETIGRLRTRVELRETDRALIPIDINWEQEQRIRDRPDAVDIPTLVDFIVHTAYEQGASDIHIEPAEDGTVVRDRIDGILHEECRMPLALHPALTSRIKVLAGMDVAERRRPQDGRITAQIRRMPLDIRVSSSPTVLGEKIVMRLLDEKALRPAPEQLGLRDSLLRLLLDKIAAPHGLVMLSGPTGSGKTTTLYSCLSALDRQRRNVLTIEDPVEYRLKGVHQMQVNERIGLTFASGLRNILRQDPDVIMVGECRDVETARMAIQASLTGHVVFSTIHANDAVGVISRLIDMQIDPYLVATALSLPIAQRLVRALCPRCRTTVDGSEMLEMLRADGVSDDKMARLGLHIDAREPCNHAPGCPHCRHTGYAGRQAVFEMFEITEPMRDLIAAKGFSADELRHLVQAGGNATMVDNALSLVADGLTTHAEIVRVFGDGTS
jgi:type II secretory ATPase GspE/PulE/Tfp pilus assembly ATPase PilB-like protein